MADVVYHEYGHGLQQFIYDPYSPSYNSSGLSEGCSDYWGISANVLYLNLIVPVSVVSLSISIIRHRNYVFVG